MCVLYLARNVPNGDLIYTTTLTLGSSEDLKVKFIREKRLVKYTKWCTLKIRIVDSEYDVVLEEDYEVDRREEYVVPLPTLEPGEYTILVYASMNVTSSGDYTGQVIIERDGEVLDYGYFNVKVGKYLISILGNINIEEISPSMLVTDDDNFRINVNIKPSSSVRDIDRLTLIVDVTYYDEERKQAIRKTRTVNIGIWKPKIEVDCLPAVEDEYLYYNPDSGEYTSLTGNTVKIDAHGATPYPLEDSYVRVKPPPTVRVTDVSNMEYVNGYYYTSCYGLKCYGSKDDVVRESALTFDSLGAGVNVFKVEWSASKGGVCNSGEEFVYTRSHMSTRPLSAWVLHPLIVSPGSSVRLVVILHNRLSEFGATVYTPDDITHNGAPVLYVLLHNGEPVVGKVLVRFWRSA